MLSMEQYEFFINNTSLKYNPILLESEDILEKWEQCMVITTWISRDTEEDARKYLEKRLNTHRNYEMGTLYITHFSFNEEKCEYKVSFYIREETNYSDIIDYQI